MNPPPLESGCYYHIHNRGNNGEDLFREQRNYAYFLKLYAHHVSPVADTFVYCLMRNHFHLLIRIKDDVPDTATGNKGMPPASQAFADLFKAYTQAINKAYARTGTLFERPFHRIKITNDFYFTRTITYIHLNPQKHGFVSDFRDWPHSSYSTLVMNGPTRLQRESVLNWFGGLKRFAQAHDNAKPDAWLSEQDFE